LVILAWRRHGGTPRVDPSACAAATAVVRAAVRIGTDALILFGAVLIAEDGVIWVGDRTVVMENAPREVAEYLAAHRIMPGTATITRGS
jgi:carbonic anhydrase/acetyltransferase-like protein (isoleucine patch superfamily)